MVYHKANNKLLHGAIEKWFEGGITGQNLYEISTKSKFRVFGNLLADLHLSNAPEVIIDSDQNHLLVLMIDTIADF
jgi:hypothetical protein